MCAVKTALERLGDACADAYASVTEALGADDLLTNVYDPADEPDYLSMLSDDAWL